MGGPFSSVAELRRAGNVLSLTNELGAASSFSYDAFRRLTSCTNHGALRRPEGYGGVGQSGPGGGDLGDQPSGLARSLSLKAPMEFRRRALDKAQLALLGEVLEKQEPALLEELAYLGVLPLTRATREAMREALASELCETGLDPDDEPNTRGLALEDLIDILASY